MAIAVAVTPIPVFVLFFAAAVFEVHVAAMRVVLPVLVVDDFIVVPNVVVAVDGIIDAVIAVRRASAHDYERRKARNQKQGTDPSRNPAVEFVHVNRPPHREFVLNRPAAAGKIRKMRPGRGNLGLGGCPVTLPAI